MKCLDSAHDLEFIKLDSTCKTCGINVSFCTNCLRIQPAQVIPSSLGFQSSWSCSFCLQDLIMKPTNLDFILINKILSPLGYKRNFYSEMESLKRNLATQKISINYLLTGDREIPTTKVKIRRRKKTRMVEFGVDYNGWIEFLRLREILELLKDGSFMLIKKQMPEFGQQDFKMLQAIYAANDGNQDFPLILDLARKISSNSIPMKPMVIKTGQLHSKQFLKVMHNLERIKYENAKREIQNRLKLVLLEIQRLEILQAGEMNNKVIETNQKIRRDPLDLKRVGVGLTYSQQQISLLKSLYSTGLNSIS